MIELQLLGTGAMMPLPHRWLSSLLVRCGSSLVLFDCGEGTQVAMRATGWGFKRLDAICLSHLHADHVAGLPGLCHTVANSGRTEPLRIYGPPGTAAVVDGLRVIARELPYPVAVQEIEGGAAFPLPEGLLGRAVWAAHRIPCLAYRVDLPRQPRFEADRAEALGVPRPLWSHLQRGEAVEIDGRQIAPAAVLGPPRPGVAFAFVTDTRPAPAIVDLARGVDLLVSEATFALDEHQELAEAFGHMTFREAAVMARAAGAAHLWLTHFSPRIERPEEHREIAAAIFPAVEIGAAGLAGSLRFDQGYLRGSAAVKPPAPATARS